MVDWSSIHFDPLVRQIFVPLISVFSVCNIFVGSFTICIVSKKTPSDMRTYRVLLLNILFWSLTADVHMGIMTEFEVFLPLFCYRLNGFLGLLNVPEMAVTVLGNLTITFYVNIAVAAFLPLQIRFLLIVFEDIFAHISKKVAYSYCIFTHIFMSSVCFGLYAVWYIPVSEVRETFQNYSNLALVFEKNVACLNFTGPDKTYFLIFAFGFIILLTTLMFLHFILSVKHLQKEKCLFNLETFKLKQRLTRNLMIITWIPVIFIFVPIWFMAIASYIDQPFSYHIYEASALCISLHGTAVSVVTLSIYDAYRRSVREIVGKAIKVEFLARRQSKVVNITTLQSKTSVK